MMFDELKEKYPQDARLLENLRSVCNGDACFVFADGIDDQKAEDYTRFFKAFGGDDAVVTDVKSLVDELVDYIIFDGGTDAFFDEYKDCKVLVLSGFQFYLGKTETQRELYRLLKYRADKKLATAVLFEFVYDKENSLHCGCLFDLLAEYSS
ncbi:MAG: hypothetical protein IIW48_01480 [Clostridia bacterium]|nr:hypothetical protein [Clostridia bacterium]